MCKKLSIISLLCVAMLFPSVASAQDVNIFAKQKVYIASIKDRNDRKLLPEYKASLQNMIRDAFVNSPDYEAYNVNTDDIIRSIRARGGEPTPPEICEQLDNKGIEFVVFTEVMTTSPAFGTQQNNVEFIFVASLYRIRTRSKVLSEEERSLPNDNAMRAALGRLMSKLFGVNLSGSNGSQYAYGNQQTRSSHSYNSNFNGSNSSPSSPQGFVEQANCGLNMKMIRVDGGTFQMGATLEQGGDTDSDEKPIHNVTLNTFYIAECEVTQAQWQKIMGTTVYDQRNKANPDWPMRGVGDNYPMYYVNWNEAQVFCQELSSITGRRYRLPTEAEWEYAARGGNKAAGTMYSGGGLIDAVAWYKGNSNDATHPVKQKRANPLGLYDMSGNVWEWCSDWYGSYSSSSQNNPTGASSGGYRVLRGGSWFNDACYCRVSYRGDNTPSHRDHVIGFRVVCLP